MEIFSLSSAPSQENPSEPTPVPGSKITALKPGLKNKDRVNVFIDGAFAFSLDLAQVVDFKLKIGTPVSPEDRKKYESASEFGKLYASTLEWIFARPRSVKETRNHLVQKLRRRDLDNKLREQTREKIKSDPEFRTFAREKHLRTHPSPLFSEEDIETVVTRLQEKGYLDDKKFAKYYIENRNIKKGISKRQLSLELSKKGIASDLISDLLSASPRSEEEEIKKVIEKKRNKKTKDQILRYLISRGFSYDLSKSVLAEY